MTCSQGHEIDAEDVLGPDCTDDCRLPGDVGAHETAGSGDLPEGTGGRYRATVGEITVDLVPDTEVLVGRAPESPLASALQPRYDTVSRRHLTLRIRDGVVAVTPLATTNGTFLAEVPLEPGREYPFSMSQTLWMGRYCCLRIEAVGDRTPR